MNARDFCPLSFLAGRSDNIIVLVSFRVILNLTWKRQWKENVEEGASKWGKWRATIYAALRTAFYLYASVFPLSFECIFLLSCRCCYWCERYPGDACKFSYGKQLIKQHNRRQRKWATAGDETQWKWTWQLKQQNDWEAKQSEGSRVSVVQGTLSVRQNTLFTSHAALLA